MDEDEEEDPDASASPAAKRPKTASSPADKEPETLKDEHTGGAPRRRPEDHVVNELDEDEEFWSPSELKSPPRRAVEEDEHLLFQNHPPSVPIGPRPRALLRYVMVVVDLSAKTAGNDIWKPSNRHGLIRTLSNFVDAFHEQNPVGLLGVCALRDARCEEIVLTWCKNKHVELWGKATGKIGKSFKELGQQRHSKMQR